MNIKAEITISHKDVMNAVEQYIASQLGMGTNFKISLLDRESGNVQNWTAVGTLDKATLSYMDR